VDAASVDRIGILKKEITKLNKKLPGFVYVPFVKGKAFFVKFGSDFFFRFYKESCDFECCSGGV